MNKSILPTLAAACFFAAGTLVNAADTYQVTGPVVEVTDSKIVVMKGKEKWELARNADTKVTGDLKVGAKVTIKYAMTAQSIDAKAEAPAKDAKAAKSEASPKK